MTRVTADGAHDAGADAGRHEPESLPDRQRQHVARSTRPAPCGCPVPACAARRRTRARRRPPPIRAPARAPPKIPNIQENSSNAQKPLRRTSSIVATAKTGTPGSTVADGRAQRPRQGGRVTGCADDDAGVGGLLLAVCDEHRRGRVGVVVHLGRQEVRHDADDGEPRRPFEIEQLDAPADRVDTSQVRRAEQRLVGRGLPRGVARGDHPADEADVDDGHGRALFRFARGERRVRGPAARPASRRTVASRPRRPPAAPARARPALRPRPPGRDRPRHRAG